VQSPLVSKAEALLELGRALKRAAYGFVTVTPETHARVNARAARQGTGRARDVRDVFGWSRPFAEELLPREWLELMRAGEVIEREGDAFRSTVRFSSLDGELFVHSAFPTRQADAVFFGPDTYRFCALLRRWAPAARRLADIGCGSGAGALSLRAQVGERVLADINPRALELAVVNAALSGLPATIVQSDLFAQLDGAFDLIVANPPYMRDAGGRIYRDGGGDHGEGLSARIVREALPRLAPGGTLIVYTGSAFVAGQDAFLRAVLPVLATSGCAHHYEEIDPDVFGDELEQPHCEAVERIAAVGLRVQKPG
jgi:methylase of polypeptide subunit release factors